MLLRRLGEQAYSRLLEDHHALIRSSLSLHGGQEVDTAGDGFFAVFNSVRACIASVAEMQQKIEHHQWPPDGRVRVRMGVHSGEASRSTTGLVGLDVHRAARVAAVAHGGQVVLSEAAAALVRDSLPPGVSLRDLGPHYLKDLGRPEQIFQLCVEDLQADFPPLRSLGNPALGNNLPVELTPFIGRERELGEVTALVGAHRLVTLTGAGGSGKTRLGVQAAAELLDGSGDGVWLVELASITDPEQVPSSIAAALHIPSRSGWPALESLIGALTPQDILVVLDNCEHLIRACAKTADSILRACPKVHIVATSREPLGIAGETVYRVPSLSLPDPDEPDRSPSEEFDAVALFAQRARAQGVDLRVDGDTFPLLVSVCRRLDGMPLAIELAAARLRSLSLRDLSDRLDQRFRLLTGGSRTALARQQTLRATVDWSYALSSDAERALLRRLSVFAEGFDLNAAEAVCGFGDIDAFEVTELLGSLVDKSLVVAEPTRDRLRYRLLETIRQFAAERLLDNDEAEAGATALAHCEYYLAVAEEAHGYLSGPDQGRWLARLDTDQANLRRAFEHALGDPDLIDLVLRFAVALRRWWFSRGRNEEVFASLAPVLERAEAHAEPNLFAKALQATALLATSADIDTKVRIGSQAMAEARRCNDDRLLVESLFVVASNYALAGRPEEGLTAAEEAVTLARKLGDDDLVGLSLISYLLCCKDSDPRHSERLFNEGIAATERCGDRLLNVVMHNNAGVHHLLHGNLVVARTHMQHAIDGSRAIGSNSMDAGVNLAWISRQEGDTAGAQTLFAQSFRASRRIGDRSNLGYASLGLACLAGDRGDWPRSSVLHGIAQAFLTSCGQEWQVPEDGYRRASIDEARTQLGQEQYERLNNKGANLGFDDSIAFALMDG